MVRVPKNGTSTSVGEMLREEFLKPLNMSVHTLIEKMGVDDKTVEDLVSGKGYVTEEVAKGLERALGMEAKFWLNLQEVWDKSNEG